MSDVVIIEDESVLREVLIEGLSGILPELSFQTFGSVEEAVKEIGQVPPRLVISDVRLPGRSGVDLLIDAQKKWPDTRFILMTAFATLVSQEQASEFGALRLLRKPFALQDLASAIEVALRQESFSGKFRGISLIDLMQVINLGQKTLAIFVQRGPTQAALYFNEGEIFHAAAEELVGVEAFNTIVRWQGGEVDVRYGLEIPEHSIRMPFQHMILEAMRQMDDENKEGTANDPFAGDLDAEDLDLEISANAVRPPDDEPPAGNLLQAKVQGRLDAGAKSEFPTFEITPSDIEQVDFFRPLIEIQGFVAVALVDSDHGTTLGTYGFESQVNGHAGSVVSGVVQTLRARHQLAEGFASGDAGDVLFSLGHQYHILKPLECNPSYCFYAVFERTESNLERIRPALRSIEEQVAIP